MAGESVHKTEKILIVCDAEVASDLVFLNIRGVDRHNDLGLILELAEHGDLGVGFKSGEYSGRVVVVEKLAAKFQIELAAELRDAASDVLRLGL